MRQSCGILAVDFGTSKVHTNLIGASDGSLLASCTNGYAWRHPQTGWSELDPEEVWRAAQDAVREVLAKRPANVELRAIVFSYFGDAFVPVDAAGNPLYKLVLAMDARGSDQVEAFCERIDESRYLSITGGPAWPDWTPLKLMWFKSNRPELYRSARYFLSFDQYIQMRLGLGLETDYTMASRKMCLDIASRRWSREILDALELPDDALGPMPAASTHIAGRIRRFGDVELPCEVPVVLGGHDSECGFMGLGVLPEGNGILGNTAGTYDHLGFFVNRYVNTFAQYGTMSWCGPVDHSHVVMAASVAGPNLRWLMETIFEQKGSDSIGAMFARARFDGTNRIVLKRSLHTAHGEIDGLTLSSTREELFAAIVEGITYPLRSLYEGLEQVNGGPFSVIRIGGGGARSVQWLQLKADVLNVPVQGVSTYEISSVGAAIYAATAVGVYASLAEATERMVHPLPAVEPRPEIVARYRERYQEYRSISEGE